MMRLVLLLIFFIIISASSSMASAPVKIALSYDLDKGVLHVDAMHPSFDLNKSYIRLINIYVNGTAVSSKNYYRQDEYDKFTDDLPVTAQVGDVIKVELFASLGGDLSQELTVKKPGDPDQQKSVGTGINNETVANATSTSSE